MLGGSHFQISAIQYAKDQGHYVITCDYLPNNPGHKFADEYFNISTTDKEAVLKLASKLKIDGIVCYASDPAAPTQAYVAEKLGLPGNPFASVNLLCHKDEYRALLLKHGFCVPKSKGFSHVSDAIDSCDEFMFPVVIKPVDSSGSRGVSILKSKDDMKMAFNKALSFSRAGRVIIEEFVEKEGFQIAGDGFIRNSELVFRCFANEHYDLCCNPGLPMVVADSYPYVGSREIQDKIHQEIQRLINILNLKMGALNFDIRLDKNNNVYLMEVGPRNGGGLLPEVTHMITGIDTIKSTVDAALGIDCEYVKMRQPVGYYSTYIIHSHKDGILQNMEFSPEIDDKIIFKDIWVKPGEKIMRYDGSDKILGMLILTFESQNQMIDSIENMDTYLQVNCV
jgi:biotin carboxylase